jgi:transcriptional regulator with XRE-family HTH domain
MTMTIAPSRENFDVVRRQLGANVRRWRGRRGWTQDQLAEQASISAKFVGEVERGEEPLQHALIGRAAPRRRRVELRRHRLTHFSA